ncbi:MAG: NAD-binding protein [Planctomycetes bacterium]|nr:NAD-binding protein [Planctomycetota bacterium]
MEQHYILCGLGQVGLRVLEHLRAAGMAVAVIDSCCKPDDPRLEGVQLVSGDCRQPAILEQAGLANAKGVLIVTSNDLVNLSTVLLIRNLHPTVRVVVRMFNQNLLARLGSAVANVHALSTSGLAGPLLALIARTGGALGVFRMADGARHKIAELQVATGSILVGQTLAALGRQHRITPVAHFTAGQEAAFALAIKPDAVVQSGDQLVVCGPADEVAPLLARSENESFPDLLWAGTVRRLGRVIWRSVTMIDLPVKVCTSIFLSVILISMMVFHLGMKNDTIIDAFYRTISLMATGADMRGNEVDPGTWQKAFISGLRLIGTALTAAFTAIFTNYLVRANLGGALEIRRIPDGGHLIVCGLGNVGFRVVEELLSRGERVVAIERTRDNPFIATARRLGAAVIIGDATVLEALKQAHAAAARAVVAASSNDLVNTEIALQVRELNPSQRVVVRLTDPALAKTLREAANVRLALSIPELAAPAFVARLFGDRVRSIFLCRGCLVAVFDLVVREKDALLLETPLEKLAEAFHMVVLHRIGSDGAAKSIDLDGRLAPGDVLTVIATLNDLQRIMQRETAAG